MRISDWSSDVGSTDIYFEALFATTDVPESADFVMHWWDKAAVAVRKGGTRRFGFVTTNSISQKFSRRVVAKHLETADRISLIFAIANHPWVDEKRSEERSVGKECVSTCRSRW